MTSYFDIAMQGGIVMVPILLCSLIAVAIFFERLVLLRRAQVGSKQFMVRLRTMITQGRIKDAFRLCTATSGSLPRILQKTIAKRSEDRRVVREVIETAGKEEVYYLEKNLGVLATISGVAPLIGFLGTVVGMIQAFMQIQVGGGNPNPADLAGGIWVALVTTAAGLSVGIPTQVCYNYLVSRVQKVVFEMEVYSTEVLHLLFQEPKDDELQDRERLSEHI